MRSFSPLQMFMTFLFLLVLSVFILAPKNSPGEMHRELVTLTIPAGETASNVVATSMNGTTTFALAEAVEVSTPTLTVTMEAFLGSSGSMTLASDTMATTATATIELSSLKSIPVAGETRISATAEGGPEEDLTVRLLILYKDEY